MGLSMSPTRPSSRPGPAPQPLDGTAIAAAVKRYAKGEIGVKAFLDELRSLRVNDDAAARLAEACAPAHMREAV